MSESELYNFHKVKWAQRMSSQLDVLFQKYEMCRTPDEVYNLALEVEKSGFKNTSEFMLKYMSIVLLKNK